MSARRDVLIMVVWLSAALLLAALTWQVRGASGPMTADVHWSAVVAAMRSDRLTPLMRLLHDVQGKLVATAIVSLASVLAWRRRWQALLLLVAMVPLGMLANAGLKLVAERPRPAALADVGWHGFAFPSGHAAAITLFCGYLVIQAFRHSTRWPWRISALAAGLTVVALVAFSRVYLGVHQPSDVVAGVLFGIAWLGGCLSGSRWLGRAARPTATGE